jgi:hypothetical protein
MKATQNDKLIIINDCPSDLLDNLDGLAYARLSGDRTLLIHTNDLAVTIGERATKENIQKVIEVIEGISGAQINLDGQPSLPDAFLLLSGW